MSRAAGPQAEAVVEQRGADADGDVSPSAGTVGPSVPLSDGGAPVPRLAGVPPAVRNRARSVSVRSSSRELAPVLGDDVERDEAGGRRRRGHDPGLVAPWNGTAGSRASRLAI